MKSCILFVTVSCFFFMNHMTHAVNWFWCTAAQINSACFIAQINNAQVNIRSVRLYDQFQTYLLCTILWVSPEVQSLVHQLHRHRYGTAAAWLEKLVSQDNSLFVILSNTTVGTTPPCCLVPWLLVNNCWQKPREVIPLCQLPHEIQCIFGKKYRYREQYMVLFDNPKDKPLLSMKSATHAIPFSWNCNQQQPCVVSGKERTRIL